MDPDEHISTETLASLAEGRVPEEEAEPVLRHLSRCRSCMAAYVEAVRYRAAWLAVPEAFEPPEELVRRGLSAAGVTSRPGPRPSGRRPSPLIQRLSYAAALLGLVLVFMLDSPRPGPEPTPRLPDAVSIVLAREALNHGLLLPGATEFPPAAEVMRGIETAKGRAVDESIQALRGRCLAYPSGRAPARMAYALAAAQLATGRVSDAQDALDLARDRSDCSCKTMQAVLLFRNNSSGAAEEVLARSVRDGCRDDVTRADLAILRAMRKDTALSYPVLREFAGHLDALGERVRSELGERE